MNTQEIAEGILNDIEGVLGNSLPLGDDPYFEETKKIAIIFVDRILYNFCNDAARYTLYLEVKKYIQNR